MNKPDANVQPRNLSVEALKRKVAHLSDWIRKEGIRTDTCTFYVLGERCEGCRCSKEVR